MLTKFAKYLLISIDMIKQNRVGGSKYKIIKNKVKI